MTAKENIFFAAEARRVPRDVRDQLYERLNELLRLSSFADRRAVKLSGGEKQRVALARALMGQPRFLFLDEPFSSLDAQLRGEARRLVQMTLKDMGIPALLITHDEEDVRALASQVIRIHSGKIQS
jgi:ABC-type Fe3+/spermidine/putrescine transport system ATPase subunit